jgi:hypothetical protein
MMLPPVRCQQCGTENQPELPSDLSNFCMQCGYPLRGGQPPADQNQYGQGPADPYGGQAGGLPQDPYGRQAPPFGGPQGGGPQGGYGSPQGGPYGGQAQNPYGAPQGSPYGRAPADPYANPGGQHAGPYGSPAPGQQGGFPGGQQPYGAPSPAQPPAPASAKLILESGIGKVEYPLDSGVVTIGRSRSNDISLEDARVSRHHARVVRGDRGYLIEDLNSRNGTRVDDRAIRDSAPLAEGSVVKIGDAVFRFTAAPAQPAGFPSPAPVPVPGPNPWGAPDPGQFGGPGGWGGAPAAPPAPVVYLTPHSPVQCPNCQGLRTMMQLVFPPEANTHEAQAAAQRGQIVLGEGPARPDGPNAECRTCRTRVRIMQTNA